MFNFRGLAPQEEIGAVPASYQTILSNQSFDGPEMPCRHPTLGLDGVMFRGTQFFCTVQQPVASTPGGNGIPIINSSFAGTFIGVDTSTNLSGLGLVGIPVNPLNFGKRIAFRAFPYQRYRFNRLQLRLISTNGVQQTGSIAVGYYKDFQKGSVDLNALLLSFPQIADLVPSIVSPMNIAQAVIDIPYDGPELYYIGINGGRPVPTGSIPSFVAAAPNRQDMQGLIVWGTDSNTTLPLPPATLNMFLDYELELYDPTPIVAAVPTSVEEFSLVQRVLEIARGVPEPGDRHLVVPNHDPFMALLNKSLDSLPRNTVRSSATTIVELDEEKTCDKCAKCKC